MFQLSTKIRSQVRLQTEHQQDCPNKTTQSDWPDSLTNEISQSPEQTGGTSVQWSITENHEVHAVVDTAYSMTWLEVYSKKDCELTMN